MLSKLYRRIINFNTRRRNARKLGIHFWRPAKWELPAFIQVGNHTVDLKLIKDHSTKSAFIDVLLDDCYGLTYIKKRFPGIKNVIDVGANQGLFVLQARNLFPGVSIDAYEPNENVIGFLTHHAHATNARVFNEAVGLAKGMVSMQNGMDTLHGKTDSHQPGDIIQISIREGLDRLPVKTTLLKLDCEGAEWEILKDTETMQRVSVITMEYHLDDEHMNDHHNNHQTIINLLKSLGFTILKHAINHEYWGMALAARI